MSRLLTWIGLLGLLCFGLGLASGVLLERHGRGPEDPGGALGHYREALTEAFDLGPEREGPLRAVLEAYVQAVEDIEARGLARYRQELTQEGRLCLDRVRNKILPPSDRARFDAWCAGTWQPGQPWEQRPTPAVATLLPGGAFALPAPTPSTAPRSLR